jgi:hypothetical protein
MATLQLSDKLLAGMGMAKVIKREKVRICMEKIWSDSANFSLSSLGCQGQCY